MYTRARARTYAELADFMWFISKYRSRQISMGGTILSGFYLERRMAHSIDVWLTRSANIVIRKLNVKPYRTISKCFVLPEVSPTVWCHSPSGGAIQFSGTSRYSNKTARYSDQIAPTTDCCPSFSYKLLNGTCTTYYNW